VKPPTLFASVIALAAAAGALTAIEQVGTQTRRYALVQETPAAPPRSVNALTDTSQAVGPETHHHHHHRRHHHHSPPAPVVAPAPTVVAPAPAPPVAAPTPAPPVAAPTPPVAAPAPAPPVAPPRAATPLAVRPRRALQLAPTPRGTGTGPLFLVVFVGAAALLGYWLRRGAAPTAENGPELRILRRAAVGVRSELLVVDVDGQRHLLGVTPASVRHITSLDSASERATRDDESPAEPIGARFEAMLSSARESSPPRAPERRARTVTQRRPVASRGEVEEQARGLLDLREAT
jgi:flagellar biogenesis protein FliO